MEYVPPVGGAADDPYIDGNPSLGVQGSAVPAAAIEHPMREILAVIERATLVPNPAYREQLADAIEAMIAAAVPEAEPSPAGYGQCRLALSGGNLLLARCNGKYLMIDGTLRVIPAAGVTLAAAGLAVDTTYYIYAAMSGSDMVLEASTTTHVQDSTHGIRVKTGDASRTLVGMARTVTGPAWVDTVAKRFVASWFNRRLVHCLTAVPTDQSTTSGSWTEISTSLRAEFLAWADESVKTDIHASFTNSSGGQSVGILPSIDGANATDYSKTATCQTANYWQAFSSAYPALLAEGHHYATGKFNVTGGTGTVRNSHLHVLTMG